MKRLPLTRDTVGTVARGHPWVYRDGVRGSADVGEPVLLVDERGKSVAWGLFERGTIAVRVLGRNPEPVEALLSRRLTRAARARAGFGADTDTWRLCNGEGDGLGGLVVDRYGPVAVLRLYSAAWERHLPAVVGALRALGLFTTVWRRFGVERVDGREGGEALEGPAPPELIEVREYGMRLGVRVHTGQKTGLFLDQRENRAWIRRLAKDRSVVNLFGYNGGFSVAAALGGAKRVVTVDLAPAAIEDAKDNFLRNGLPVAAHAFEVADAFTWKGATADLLICDPPSLAHDKDADNAARTAYRNLHRQVGALTKELLATASCTARVSGERWEEAVREGLRGHGTWTRLGTATEPADHPVLLNHPEARYLKFLLLGKLEGV